METLIFAFIAVRHLYNPQETALAEARSNCHRSIFSRFGMSTGQRKDRPTGQPIGTTRISLKRSPD